MECTSPAQFAEETLRNAESVIAFAVQDTGIGIAPEKLGIIFDAFQQSDGTTNRKYGGTGLGLSISREIATLLGGRIDAESEVGIGSRFTLYVPSRSADVPFESGLSPSPGPEPLKAEPTGTTPPAGTPAPAAGPREMSPPPSSPPPPPPAPSQPPPSAEYVPSGLFGGTDALTTARKPGAPGTRDETWPETTRLKEWLTGRRGRVLSGRRILIVDDDIRNVFAITHVLGRVGITVAYAENGRECIALLERSPDVSLVLMDIMMPEVDGYQTIRTIRRTPRIAALPIIALTAKAMPVVRDNA